MFKIVSDPTRYPIREIDLSHEAATLNFIPATSINTTDITFGRPDGGQHVYGRKGRSQFDLSISHGLTESDYKELIKMREAGSVVYVFPNFDKTTRLYAPLSSSTKALQFNPLTKKYVYDEGTFTGEDGTSYARDSEGNYSLLGSGEARFLPSAIGNGIFLTNRSTNLVDGGIHPTQSNLLISGIAGDLATYEWKDEGWDTSPAPMFSGVGRARIYGGTSTSCLLTASVTSTVNKWFTATMWLKGRCEDLFILFDDLSGVSIDSTTIDVNEEWQQVKLKLKKTTANSKLQLFFNMPGVGSNAKFFLLGPVSIEQIDDDGEYEQFRDWGGVGSTNHDELKYNNYQVQLQEEGHTISVIGKVPDFGTSSEIYRSGDGTFLKWDAAVSGISYQYGSTGSQKDITISDWENLVGEDLYTSWRERHSFNGGGQSEIDGVVYINGTEYTDSTTPGGLGFLGGAVNLYIGGQSGDENRSGSFLPQFLRVDNRYWSDDEATLHRKMFMDSTFRNLLMMTTGKKFVISAVNLSPQAGNWDKMRGTITFSEVGQESGMEIGY